MAWVLRDPHAIAIPKTGHVEHLRDNHGALELALTAEDLAAIDAEQFAPLDPQRWA